MNAPFFRRWWTVLLLCGAGTLWAHEDTIIRLEKTRLIGLPDDYGPAELDLKNFRLRIRDHEMQFPALVKNFFEGPCDVKLTASWYHSHVPKLPPYLVLHVLPKGKDFSYELMLNLNNLEVLNTAIVLQTSKSSTRSFGIGEGEWQRKEFRAAVKKVPRKK